MSYWFEEPHTLVLARARVGLCNSRKSDRLRAESETASAERALAPVLSAAGTKMFLGFS
jgi:hypothetical protein